MLLVEAAKDESGATPLFIASHYGNQKAVEFLVQHRAEVDLSLKTNASPLCVACQNGHKDTAAFLLMFGAEPNKQTDDLATSTFSAAQMGHFEIVKMPGGGQSRQEHGQCHGRLSAVHCCQVPWLECMPFSILKKVGFENTDCFGKQTALSTLESMSHEFL